MCQHYLGTSYQDGKGLAAYLNVPRRPEDKPVRSEPIDDILIIDCDKDGRPYGIERLDPRAVTLARINEVLGSLHLRAIEAEQLNPNELA